MLLHSRSAAARAVGATAAVLLMGVAVAPASVHGTGPQPEATIGVAGFTDSLVGTADAPVAVTALPDGRAVVLEQGGRARIVRNGAILPTPALTLTVCSTSERGLLGFAPDPAFLSNGYVYVYFTRPAGGSNCVNRVSRFTMSGDTIVASSEKVLLDGIGSPAGNHNGGALAVGNDGFLYVSVGDGGCDPRGDSGCAGANDAAQDLSLLNGKLLRVVRSTGAPAPGNPLSGAGTASCRVRGNDSSTPTTKCQELFAWGLRNPWRFAADPNTGATRLFVDDVGQGTREEVDLAQRGANYGWPIREGVCPQGQNPPCGGTDVRFVDPLTDYSRSSGSYVTGGAFVPNGAWPSAFDGAYLFADGGSGAIFRRSAAGTVDYGAPFATGAGGISDMDFVFEPSGWSLMYVNPVTGEVRRIRPTQSPATPSVALKFVPVSATRVFDSRDLGAASGRVRAGTSRLVRLTATQGQHRAALVTVMVVNPSSATTITMWRPRTQRPPTWTMIAATGQVTTNSVVVPVDGAGNVLLHTSGTTDLTVDVVGWYDVATNGAATNGRLIPVDPVRAVDTRRVADSANRYTRSTVSGVDVVNVPLAGRLGIGAAPSAVALFVTAIAGTPSTVGTVVAHPHGIAPRFAQVTTNGAGDVRGNMVVVPVGADGSVDLRLGGGVRHVVVDVLGSFTGPGAASSTRGTFVSIAPSRAVDTRSGIGFVRLGAGGSAVVDPTAAPSSAIGVAQTVTIVRAASAGFVRVYPNGIAAPATSNGNVTAAGQSRSAGMFTRLRSGAERATASVAMDLVVGVAGWYRP